MADRLHNALIAVHQEWLGFVQPVGLVLAPTVMVEAQAIPDRNIAARQREFRDLLELRELADKEGRGPNICWRTPDLRRLFREWLGWDEDDIVDAAGRLETLEIGLPELQTVLAPSWAVPEEQDPDADWLMLVGIEDDGCDLDKPPEDSGGWNASRHARFERLLRETGIDVGLLCTDERIRLVYAPKGESSGHLTFEFSQMVLPAGRPILSAFEMLLSADALFSASSAALPKLMARSREAQAEVSTRLSRQVLAALHELLRGFVTADVRRDTGIADLARQEPDRLYGGLITALMRLVFVLYAEDRGLMPDHPVYQQHYSLGGLFTRLRADEAAWPDTMDQRFGAWAQLLSLFRLIHGGGGHAGLSFTARKGSLFDPERFPFLEGTGADGACEIPMVPDATVWKVLQNLMMLDGERLSYRTLDVEQIGSVYEAIMGFRVELTTGNSVAVSAAGRSGVAVVVDLDGLLALDRGKRGKALQDRADRKLPTQAAALLRDADTPVGLVEALDSVVDRTVTPDIVPAGTSVLQPTDERRRSGSHYTPRSLTEPIVSEALRPIFERLGPAVTPEELLDLKVLDPAMGSGAFLVESCRQLASKLVEAWSVHDKPPDLPPDEDELLHARRLVAQRCLYGTDKNAMAVDLARLSIWLATLARDHEFTFVDHALRHGDFLVGLTQDRIASVDWGKSASHHMAYILARDRTRKAEAERARIRNAAEELGEDALRPLLDRADRHLDDVRLVGDAVVAAFFAGDRPKTRKAEREVVLKVLSLGGTDWQSKLRPAVVGLRSGHKPVYPFHFEIEFPEVFDRENPGFDAIVGNPPFLGGKRISTIHGTNFRDWLEYLHVQSNSNADIAAHFFRRAFNLSRNSGSLGLIATNTIGQGDTRLAGLRWICTNGGTIYAARRRIVWPGEAAVVVSTLHILKRGEVEYKHLDGQIVEMISAFLFHRGGHEDPEILSANAGKSFVGSYVLGMGFTFDDTDSKGIASSLADMQKVIDENPRSRKSIFPYIGGEEVNSSPTHTHHRYVINFHDWPLRRTDLQATWQEANDEQRLEWCREGIVPLDYPHLVAADQPELLAIVEDRVKPERDIKNRKALRERWWQYAEKQPSLYAAIAKLDRVLVISQTSRTGAFTFLPRNVVYSHKLNIFTYDTYAAFATLQSRQHDLWARFFGSTMKDDPVYTPSDCFETFPFPEEWETHPALEAAGQAYYDFRAALMVENDEGLTKTYNRFHDPDERDPRVARLRELHAAMDRAVLDAYGWDDIPTDCEFLLDYEIDEGSWGRKKKPWRYRWPDEVHDEALARLLKLNAERAAEERRTGLAAGRKASRRRAL